jgi:hypothetical protein
MDVERLVKSVKNVSAEEVIVMASYQHPQSSYYVQYTD